MRIAVIDCGTNTFNLIIIELLDPKKYTKVYSTRIAVKLGEGAINKGYIARAAFVRGLDAIRIFKEKFEEHKVEHALAFATSAIRDASNGEEFVREIKQTFGIYIDVIDGNREAELIYFGIREAVKLGDHISLIMDIGGGSNEFILANAEKIFWKQSFNIGAARLLERFQHSNPITVEEKTAIDAYLTEQLQPLVKACEKFKPTELVGSSGAFESLIEMIHSELGGEPLTGDKTEYEPDLSSHFKITGLIKKSTLEERRNIKGLLPIRFDMIVISCIMVDHILNLLNLEKMRVSTYSLKEGALAEYLQYLQQKEN
ncbi:phosphatase [Sphingobacteriaceae bacterium]|nr:phosphatase [Sphingobacteriaceae bacterium]